MTDTGSVTGPIAQQVSPPGPAGRPPRADPGGPQAGDLLQTLAPADGR
jgi:hypothetical protein